MKGKHHIIIETGNIKYEFDIKRNITVVQGDSATGKTTMVDIINEYAAKGKNQGIRIESDVNCVVFTASDDNWKYTLDGYSKSIIFIDEDYHFVFSKDFADYLDGSDNYYVIITRKPLKNVPYSIKEIYGIRTSGKYHFPEQVYNEFYPIYHEVSQENPFQVMILTEDKKSGFQFFENLTGREKCKSADGNANVYAKMIELSQTNDLLIIADGAAFGAYVDKVFKYAKLKGHIALYFPESFEWLLLRSDVLADKSISELLEHPEDYIDSSKYISWERFFTALLIEKTESTSYKRYNKSQLAPFYLEGSNLNKILNVIPEGIRKLIEKPGEG